MGELMKIEKIYKPLSKRTKKRLRSLLSKLDKEVFASDIFKNEREQGLMIPPLSVGD